MQRTSALLLVLVGTGGGVGAGAVSTAACAAGKLSSAGGHTVCGCVMDGGSLDLVCPNGTFTAVEFASIGNPETATCGNFSAGSCDGDETVSKAAVAKLCGGKSTCTISADTAHMNNGKDPCVGTVKYTAIELTCSTTLPPPAPPDACHTDFDCALNGICVSKTCQCDRPWVHGPGGPCTALDRLPAPITSCGPGCAYHGDTLPGHNVTESSSWGGQVTLGADGKYYMAVSEFAYGCDVGTWRSNSQVAFAQADTPVGPFKKLGVAVPTWAHNAALINIAPSGGVPSGTGDLVIVTCGRGYECTPGAAAVSAPGNCDKSKPKGKACPCVAPPAGHCHTPIQPKGSDASATFHHASSLQAGLTKFPWNPINVTLTNFQYGSWIPDLVNAAPWALPNGTVLMISHSATTGGGGMVIQRSVTGGADGWKGPYTVLTTDKTEGWHGTTRGCEDPFLWTDKRGHYHVMYHHMGAGVPPGWVGHHAWSIDGFTWSDTQPCYDNAFPIEGGATVAGVANGGAQRPKLLVENGTATHLYVAGPMSGCPKCKGDYTLVSPLNV